MHDKSSPIPLAGNQKSQHVFVHGSLQMTYLSTRAGVRAVQRQHVKKRGVGAVRNVGDVQKPERLQSQA
jgi:hypothetical protein